MWISTIVTLLLAVTFGSRQVPGQQPHAPGAPLAFEVATVKPVEPGKPILIETRVYPGGRVQINGLSLRELILEAFDLPAVRVDGLNKQMTQSHFNIEARPTEAIGRSITVGEFSNMRIASPEIRQMLQTLLVERFHLRFHIEERRETLYRLERNSSPLRLTLARVSLYRTTQEGTIVIDSHYPTGDIGVVSGVPVSIWQTSMPELAIALSSAMSANVVDNTGLSGFYNFRSKLVATEEDFREGNAGHMIVEALPEMGLKLTKSSGPVKIMVIDGVDAPTDN